MSLLTAERRLRRRAHLGLDLALPEAGEGLVVMELPAGSPLADEVKPGARLLAIDDVPVGSLDGVRDQVRQLHPGSLCRLRFDEQTLALKVQALPLEPVRGAQVVLGEVDCGAYSLRSVWTFPQGPGPYPTVWLLPSANWLSEEHVQQLWHPTLKLVQALSDLGFATLRVDRSGLGDSGGPACTDTDLESELADLAAAARHLLAEPAVDSRRWYLFGRSLGAVLVQLLAADLQPRAAAVWGGTSRPWHETMLDSALRQRRLAGQKEPGLSSYVALRERLGERVFVHGDLPREAVAREPALRAACAEEFTAERAHGRCARYFQQLQTKNVAAACGQFRGRLLVMRGELDWLTSEADAASTVAAARHPLLRTFPGVDHLMHRRGSLAVAFRQVFGGEFDACGAQAMRVFFER